MKDTKKIENTGRKTWLAGLGSYEAGREVAADKLDQFVEQTQSGLNDLIARGSKVEEQLQANLKDKFAVPAWVNKSIDAIKARLNPEPDALASATDKLEKTLNDLDAVVVELQRKKAAAKKAAEAKVQASKKAETAAPKSAESEKPKAAPAPAAKATSTTKAAPVKQPATQKRTSGTAAKPSTAAKRPATRRSKPAQS
ncbi:hypothetical protein P2G88_02485 [Aliiglaciecola sp. CAU 1673]|uniref:hypothetical protein n=1 Tax=Aliiglaciecola sp. CAU 1673 TaxID=3032595 RepID=UPI0023DBE711|nr:hypothetical protein [Aliiglaciecola sp. CAU 1673]MDF2177110.1 hypothetical protein [Aliiglaciecola sp. CAU 1673]